MTWLEVIGVIGRNISWLTHSTDDREFPDEKKKVDNFIQNHGSGKRKNDWSLTKMSNIHDFYVSENEMAVEEKEKLPR